MRSRAAPTNTAQLSRLADMAADRAVERVFTTLGVDISTPGAMIEAQRMFLGMRTFQQDWGSFKNRFWATVGGLVASGIGATLWHYFQAPKPPI